LRTGATVGGAGPGRAAGPPSWRRRPLRRRGPTAKAPGDRCDGGGTCVDELVGKEPKIAEFECRYGADGAGILTGQPQPDDRTNGPDEPEGEPPGPLIMTDHLDHGQQCTSRTTDGSTPSANPMRAPAVPYDHHARRFQSRKAPRAARSDKENGCVSSDLTNTVRAQQHGVRHGGHHQEHHQEHHHGADPCPIAGQHRGYPGSSRGAVTRKSTAN